MANGDRSERQFDSCTVLLSSSTTEEIFVHAVVAYCGFWIEETVLWIVDAVLWIVDAVLWTSRTSNV